MTVLNSDTFCAYSWFGIRNENHGEYRLCCSINPRISEYTGNIAEQSSNSMDDFLNSDYTQYVRKSLNAGVKLKECGRCWHEEAHKQQSYRQIGNQTICDNNSDINKTWVPMFFKNKKDYKSDLLLIADVKINNICNFECIMCNAKDSSLIFNNWTKNIDNEFVQDYLKKDPLYFKRIQTAKKENFNETTLERALASKTLKELKIIGGEPLVSPKVLSLLINLDENRKQKLSLVIITNGSVDLINVTNKLGNYKHIHYVVSIDSISDLQEYVRRNSNWDQISNNILNFQKLSSNRISISCELTPSAASITGLPDLIHWLSKNNVTFSVGNLIDPDYLSLSAVPDNLKQLIIDKLTAIDSVNAKIMKSKISESEYNKELFERFKQYIEWQNTYSNRDFLSIAAEWKQYFV